MDSELTIKEALEQGYEYYVFDSDGFQALKDINDVTEECLQRTDIYLVNKEPYNPSGLTSKQISEILAEHIECNHTEDSGDDTEQVYNAIKEIDFSDAEEKINEALSKLNYYRSTNIKLVPNH